MTHELPLRNGEGSKIVQNPIEKTENMSGTDQKFVPYSTTKEKVKEWKG
jgi:hypothetical protein